MQPCPSSRAAALLAVKPRLVPVVTNITVPPAGAACSGPQLTPPQLALLLHSHFCSNWTVANFLPGTRRIVPSKPFGMATKRCGADKDIPEWGHFQTPYVAQEVQSKATDPRSQWHIHGLTSSAQHLSPVASFTSAKEKLTTG